MSDTDELIKQLAQDATPIRPASHPYVQCFKWLLGLALYMALLLSYFHPRPDVMEKLQSPLYFLEIQALALVAITTALSAALLSYPDVMQKKLLAYAPIAAFFFFILIMVDAWQADNPPSPQPEHEMICTLLLSAFALLPGIWMFATMRKLASTHGGFAGITATLCAFSIGALTLRLSERTDSIIHVIEWHYVPMLGLSIIGLWLGKKLLTW